MTNHPQIDQRDAIIFGQKNIAGMRVGVKETVDQNLFQVRAKQLFRQSQTVDFNQSQRTDVGDFFTRNVFHRQHARCRVVLDRLRDNNAFEFAETVPQTLEMSSFALEIQLAQKTAPQLG